MRELSQIARADATSERGLLVGLTAVEETPFQPLRYDLFHFRADSTGISVATDTDDAYSKDAFLEVERLCALEGMAELLAVVGVL
ncbi:MAG: hypothetical protein ABI877_17455 [Gemmatimonadaceae bacterium]